ncbi:MAG: radical SAM protein, partial [Pseudoxanthomonas sp.]
MSAVPQTRYRPLDTTSSPPGGLPLDRRGRPLRDLRLSVIEACNFRCGYCMPADQVPEDYGLDSASRLSFDEIETLVRGFARIGVNKLRLTGGEPLLRKRLPELIARLSAIPG